MSGTDPSVGRGGGGPSSGPECPGQPFTTTLASPVPAVVAGLTVGTVLTVASIDTPVRAVVALDDDGNVAGAITRDPARLRACMQIGTVYTATIEAIAGGAVTVLVLGT